MKKRLVALLMATVMAFSLTACGSSDSDSASKKEDTKEEKTTVNAEDYVKVGDLEGISVTVDKYTFTEDDVASQLQSEFEYYVESGDKYQYTEIADRTDVQNGDFCNIDYEGKIDGEVFDGGTAEGYNLEIGSGSFIEGFEEGLVGHNVGEEVDLNLKFADDYQNADVAGKDVVFHVKINKIQSRTMPELTDEAVAALEMGYDTVKAFEDEVRSYLQESCDDENESAKSDAIWEAVKDVCEVSAPPQSMIDEYAEEIKANIESYASMYGVELEEFLSTYMGMDMETYETEVSTSATEAAEEDLMVQAIAKKAGLEVTDEDVKAAAETEYAEYGYESADAFLEEVGESTYKQYLLKDKVDEYLAGIVTIEDGVELNIIEEYYGTDEAEDEEADVEDTEDATDENGEEVIDEIEDKEPSQELDDAAVEETTEETAEEETEE